MKHCRFTASELYRKLMYQENIGSIIILTKNAGSHDSERPGTLNDGGTPVGIVTERDIARMIGFSARFFADMSVSEVMSKPLTTSDTNILRSSFPSSFEILQPRQKMETICSSV
jgi:CBS domain-containing protein